MLMKKAKVNDFQSTLYTGCNQNNLHSTATSKYKTEVINVVYFCLIFCALLLFQ